MVLYGRGRVYKMDCLGGGEVKGFYFSIFGMVISEWPRGAWEVKGLRLTIRSVRLLVAESGIYALLRESL